MCPISGRQSQYSSSFRIESFPLATSRENDGNTGVGHDHGEDGAQGIQICLYDAWYGIGREDGADIGGTRVDDCDGIDTRGKNRKLVQ